MASAGLAGSAATRQTHTAQVSANENAMRVLKMRHLNMTELILIAFATRRSIVPNSELVLVQCQGVGDTRACPRQAAGRDPIRHPAMLL
jgi:hypothetical protein